MQALLTNNQFGARDDSSVELSNALIVEFGLLFGHLDAKKYELFVHHKPGLKGREGFFEMFFKGREK